jgi:photosystem II stability/assembly factor-like uncharacterized protein
MRLRILASFMNRPARVIGNVVVIIVLTCECGFAQANFWEQSNGPYEGGNVISIAMNSRGHVFVGSSGVYRSTDDCRSWTPIGLSDGFKVTWSLLIDSQDHIFAGTSDGLFRSLDNGESWTHVGFSWPQEVHSLALDARGEIFAGTTGLYRSTDDGDSWTPLAFNDHTIESIAIDDSHGIMFVSALGPAPGIYRSTDNALSWTRLFNFGVERLAINANGHLLAGSTASYGIYQSTDNGG